MYTEGQIISNTDLDAFFAWAASNPQYSVEMISETQYKVVIITPSDSVGGGGVDEETIKTDTNGVASTVAVKDKAVPTKSVQFARMTEDEYIAARNTNTLPTNTTVLVSSPDLNADYGSITESAIDNPLNEDYGSIADSPTPVPQQGFFVNT